MPRFTTVLLLLVLLLVLLPDNAYAFGAGSIPSYAYLHDRAFRHGGKYPSRMLLRESIPSSFKCIYIPHFIFSYSETILYSWRSMNTDLNSG